MTASEDARKGCGQPSRAPLHGGRLVKVARPSLLRVDSQGSRSAGGVGGGGGADQQVSRQEKGSACVRVSQQAGGHINREGVHVSRQGGQTSRQGKGSACRRLSQQAGGSYEQEGGSCQQAGRSDQQAGGSHQQSGGFQENRQGGKISRAGEPGEQKSGVDQ